MENLKNVPTVIWYLIALNALLLAGVLFYYYQFGRKMWEWIEKVKIIINRIPVRKIGVKKSGEEAAIVLNRLQFPEERIDPAGQILLANLFDSLELVDIDIAELEIWQDMGVMDGTEN